MKKFIPHALTAAAFATFACGAAAQSLTADEALARVALQWNAAAGTHRAPAQDEAFVLAAEGHNAALQPSYYIFNRTRGGYVIASATEGQPAILGYTDAGSYDAQSMPPAFHAWLDEVTTYGAYHAAKASAGKAPAVEQLLGDIAWTQDTPMNDHCPRYSYGGYNYPTYAGCVAIALGQIMCYHQYPAQGKGSVSYTTDSYNINVSSDLASHTYDWTKILPNYVYTQSTSAEREEVAKFVFDVAAATQMDFTPSASNTQDFRAAQALVKNFGYDASLQLIDHRFYTTTEWTNTLRAELDAKRPVYVSGANVYGSNSSVAGHAFVVDGYNADGFFHVNWGWNGSSNGYYLLTDLTPKDKQGIGGSNAGYAFMQNAIIGIAPDHGGAPALASLCLIFDQVWTERDENGTSINFFVGNPTAVDFTGYIALRITDKSGKVVSDPMSTAYKLTCKAGYSGERGWYIDLPSLDAGCTFELVYQREGETDWHVAGARTGSPHSLVSYTTSGGAIALGNNAAELFQLRLADLKADGALTAGADAKFTAKIKNESDYEYFAPLYLMVYDADESLVGYTDYQLYLVPAHGEADVKFSYTLPAKVGSYHFCVSYETLGYNYDYSPMLRADQQAYDYVFNVVKAGGEGGGDVTPGDGSVQDYVMECVDYGADAVRRDVKVRFEGNEVYIQGISEEVPEGWAHATLKDGVAVFETPLLLGEWNYYGSMRKQYITGADTGTGDVSGLEMLYDDDARSFTSFSNNWILLTGDPKQVGYYYDHLYNSVSFIPANQAGDSPTITPPDGLATSVYQLSGRHPYSGIPTDYTLNVGYDGKDVYVQGLYPAFPNAWVKGTVADGKATFKTPQYIGNYHGLYNMYVAGVDPVAEELCALVMDYDSSTRTFTTTDDCWFIVQAGETNVMPMMLLDEVSMAPYKAPALDYSEVVLPAALAAKAQAYNFSATNADSNEHVTANAQVVLDGDDVYVKGLSTYFPDAWVKGHRDGTIIVFPRNQHMGLLQGNDIWLGAGDAMSGEMIYGNFILQFNPVTSELTQPEVNYLAINASTTKVYHLELYKGVTLSPNNPDGIGSVLAPDAYADDALGNQSSDLLKGLYDLQGRRLARAARGYVIQNGKVRLR